MQFKPGTVLTFMGNEKDLSVVIGFIGDYVICYDIFHEDVGTYRRSFILRYFQSL